MECTCILLLNSHIVVLDPRILDFLLCVTQRVRVNGEFSDLCGTPQGCVLSPLQYIMSTSSDGRKHIWYAEVCGRYGDGEPVMQRWILSWSCRWLFLWPGVKNRLSAKRVQDQRHADWFQTSPFFSCQHCNRRAERRNGGVLWVLLNYFWQQI